MTVNVGSVSERIGVPGGSGSPSFTKTCPIRIGQCPTIMSVGRNTTSLRIERSVTVTVVWPASSTVVPRSGS